ncbi:MAG: dTMP kinase [Bacteroidales bacterium]|nr:dTMP kinase [Bacteroidales bacterium]
MLIVLEGLDGAGKSTQVKLLKEYIQSKGKQLRYLHFPRFDAPVYGDLIAKFLRGDFGAINQVHPQLVALLFAEDRRDAAALIREWLGNGDVVLLDRYVYSNIAYQCSKIKDKAESDSLREWIFNLEYNIYNIPRPDVNLFLDVPISFVDKKLKENREGDDREYLKGKSDIHEADIQFQIDVRELYLEQTVLDKDFIRVECSGPQGEMLAPLEIFANIEKALAEFI